MTETPVVEIPQRVMLSLGAGVQSTAILILAKIAKSSDTVDEFRRRAFVPANARGEEVAAAYRRLRDLRDAVFSDTGWEPAEVYAHLDRIDRDLAKPAEITIHRVSNGNIRDDALDPDHRFASMPLHVDSPCSVCDGEGVLERFEYGATAWRDEDPGPKWLRKLLRLVGVATVDELDGVNPYTGECPACGGSGRQRGMARRQCTKEYKLVPIKRKVREVLGFPHPVRVPRGVFVEQMVGISRDEVHRAKDSGINYSRNVFPLLDLAMSRRDCERLLHAFGYAETPKSACIGCPFHHNSQWRDLRDNHPEEWADAVEFDAEIRKSSARATAAGQDLRGSMFLHQSLRPLDEAPIDRITRAEKIGAQLDLLDLVGDLEAGVDVDGDRFDAAGTYEQGCGPWSCRSDGA